MLYADKTGKPRPTGITRVDGEVPPSFILGATRVKAPRNIATHGSTDARRHAHRSQFAKDFSARLAGHMTLSADTRQEVQIAAKQQLIVEESHGDKPNSEQEIFGTPVRLATSITNSASAAIETNAEDSFALPIVDVPLQGDLYPIDLPTSLRLAGASNLQIRLARERVCEAMAQLKVARLQWIPSLNAGLGYNRHDGRLQQAQGQVLEASRNSFFAGGGAQVNQFPLAGGSNGPARLFVDLSLSDVFFDPLAAKQNVRAVAATRDSRFNDVLFQVAYSYLELSRGQSQMAIALNSEKNSRELLRLTEAQEQSDVGLRADVERARAEVAARKRQAMVAEERLGMSSARLVQLLRLDPCVTLVVQDVHPVPLELFAADVCLEELIPQGVASRPERLAAKARVREAYERKRQEDLRPWLPNVHVGYSGGTFAGGEGSFIGKNGSRGDLDVLAVWQLRNAGLGMQAVQAGVASRHRQARLTECSVQEQIAAEVSSAFRQVSSRRCQIKITQQRVAAAAAALPLNFHGIVGRQLRAIEAQQAIQGLDDAFNAHLDAIVGFNQAQFELLRAVGTPAAAGNLAIETSVE